MSVSAGTTTKRPGPDAMEAMEALLNVAIRVNTGRSSGPHLGTTPTARARTSRA